MSCCNPSTLEVNTLGEVTILINNGEIRSLTDGRYNLQGTGLSGDSVRRALNSMIGYSFPDGGNGKKRVLVHLIINRSNIISETLIGCEHEGDPAYERLKCSWDEDRRIQLSEGYDTPIFDFPIRRVQKECNGEWCVENIAGDMLQVGLFVGSFFFPFLLPIGYDEFKKWLEELEKVRSQKSNNQIGRSLFDLPVNRPALVRFLKTALNKEEEVPEPTLAYEMFPETAMSIINAVHIKTDSQEDNLIESLKEYPELKAFKISLDQFHNILSNLSMEKPDSRLILDALYTISELQNMRIKVPCSLTREAAWIMAGRTFIDKVESWPSKKTG